MIGSEKALRSSYYILCIFMALFMSCFIGSRRDACRYNLKESSGAADCELLTISAFVPSQEATNSNVLSALMLSCYQYYEKLQECEKEEYKYMPAIYGINSNPTSDAIAERIVREK
ncbi:hypothetical protein DLM76_20350 [Leptospira yasudae]|nr:hypothetical protein DLM76_20350 [Leptospira yasudae]